MPCGGIWPLISGEFLEQHHGKSDADECFHCGKEIKKEDLMWCEEWDCYLHRACVVPFLETEEGKVILAHGHAVVLYLERPNGSQSE